jgi:serine/threonine protein kinase
MAPEILQNCNYNYKVDIWGLGILLYEMLHGGPPDAYQFILNKNHLEMDDSLSTNAKEIIRNLLRFDPKERMTFEEIFRDPWLTSFESVYKIKIETYVVNNKLIRNERDDQNKENKRKSDPSPLRNNIRAIYAQSLNKYSEDFTKMDKNFKLPKKTEEDETPKVFYETFWMNLIVFK